MSFTLPAPGGCNCGQVRYLVKRAPLTCYICHCHLCQKRTGSPFSMSLVLPDGAAEIVVGEPQRSERVLPGGGVNASLTCSACCSRLWTQRVGGPTINLRAGTLDDTTGVQPVAQFWVSSAQPWAVVADILTFEENPTDAAAVRQAWKARTAVSAS
jgi:hypothetical protein